MIQAISEDDFIKYRSKLGALYYSSAKFREEGNFVISSGRALLGIGKTKNGRLGLDYVGSIDTIAYAMDSLEFCAREDEILLEEFLHKSPFKDLVINLGHRVGFYFDDISVHSSRGDWVIPNSRELNAALVENDVTISDVVDLGNGLEKLAPLLGPCMYFYSKEKGLHLPW